MSKSKTDDAENCIEVSYDWCIITYLLLVKNSFLFVHLLVTEKLRKVFVLMDHLFFQIPFRPRDSCVNYGWLLKVFVLTGENLIWNLSTWINWFENRWFFSDSSTITIVYLKTLNDITKAVLVWVYKTATVTSGFVFWEFSIYSVAHRTIKRKELSRRENLFKW